MIKELFKYGSGPTQVEVEYSRRYRLYAVPILIMMSALVVAATSAVWSILMNKNYYWFLIFIIIAVLFYFIVNFFGKKINKNDRSYGAGSVAEDLVVAKLSTLGNEYQVINDIPQGKGMGNIDHVVIGPTGIYVIETKANIKDKIVYYDNNIRKLTKFGRKYVKQTARNAFWLYSYIKDNLGIEEWVTGLVVRPLKEDGKIINCYKQISVLDGNEVCNYIKNNQHRLDRADIGKIRDNLISLKRNK